MEVDLADGQRMSIVSDETWKICAGPITANDIAAGEAYDARLEQPGWDMPGFDDSDWEPAIPAKAPGW